MSVSGQMRVLFLLEVRRDLQHRKTKANMQSTQALPGIKRRETAEVTLTEQYGCKETNTPWLAAI